MKNLEKLGYSKNKDVDESAVSILHIELYKPAKKWLESEEEE